MKYLTQKPTPKMLTREAVEGMIRLCITLKPKGNTHMFFTNLRTTLFNLTQGDIYYPISGNPWAMGEKVNTVTVGW